RRPLPEVPDRHEDRKGPFATRYQDPRHGQGDRVPGGPRDRRDLEEEERQGPDPAVRRVRDGDPARARPDVHPVRPARHEGHRQGPPPGPARCRPMTRPPTAPATGDRLRAIWPPSTPPPPSPANDRHTPLPSCCCSSPASRA